MTPHVDHQFAEFGQITTLPEFERWLIASLEEDSDVPE